ncbi:MAG: GHKL domain-containing protein [Defluviitaleaceae bacterium]|nr:GHKL domain-containing protein [Defluviitaleaceae bacterium]
MVFIGLIFINIFILLAVHKFTKIFLEKRITNFTIYVLACLSFLIAISISILFVNIPIINLMLNIAAIFLITLNYEAEWKRKISAVLIIYVSMIISDALLSTATRTSLFSAAQQTEFVFMHIVGMGLLMYLSAMLANHFKNLGTMAFHRDNSSSEAYSEKLKSKFISKEREYFYNQCELMRESVDEMKSFHHDVIKHLSAVSGFIKREQYEDSLAYIENLIGKVDVVDYSDTGNTAFDSIVNYKLRNAKASGIELEVAVSVPPKLQIDVSDVVSIVGNLLDNALEAVCETPEKKLTLDIRYNKGGVHVYVKNSHSGNIDRSENGQIKTTKKGNAHGYGLKNVRKSIEKYNGDLEITTTETEFTVEAFLYVLPLSA